MLFFGFVFCRTTRVPGLYFAKSITISYRSAMMWRIFLTDCGYGIRPPSVPITVNASPVDSEYS